jgi:hypothetical protein
MYHSADGWTCPSVPGETMTMTPWLCALGLLPLAKAPTPTFADDVRFLKAYSHPVVLGEGARRIVVVPDWQARVMTSALSADQPGFGWINYAFIKTKKLVPHMNVFGGEDRIWLGPEGGQFSLFFKKGQPFDLAHWQTPPAFDTVPFRVVSQTKTAVTCKRRATLKNYSGYRFDVEMTRTIQVLGAAAASHDLGVEPSPAVKVIAYESVSGLKNVGRKAWTEKTGMPSIWILGMLRHSPTTTVVVPFQTGDVSERGPIVNDNYFGKVPSDRLIVGDGVLYFRADGKYRSKIGLNPRRAKNVLGSWDPVGGVLTVVQYTKPEGATKYVNSMWELQKHPFAGDCLNSYNDGPPAPGKKPLGPFYEVESSSPAAALKPGASISHTHRTFHFAGDRNELEKIAQKLFGVGLDNIAGAFKGN